MNLSYSTKKALVLFAICVLTFICFRYTLNNQFTNWDDDFYVTNDPFIRSFTPHNLKVIFTEDITRNNYHPLCMLSLAVNYHFAQLNPTTYYLTNILIHIINVVLVFFLFLQLCRYLKRDDNSRLFIASFGALWFGIHPMHVESVAWIAERKDVLYTCFYLAGLLCYLRYNEAWKKKWYWLTFLLFVLSCLSKPMAVVFPLSLLCVDIFLKRPFGKKLITEKVIFFACSLLCGGMAFYTQNKTGAVASFGALSIAERVMYAAYGFIMYLSKLFNPTYLSTFYPYPYRYITGYLPGIYYAAPFIALGVVLAPLYYMYKNKSPYFRIYAFGMGFFVANVIFVLQFISVGAAIMSDRYSYVAYIGLFFLLAYAANELIGRIPTAKTVVITILLLGSGGLAYLCYERTFVWHDSETLLTDAIEKYPYRALLSYKWRGNYYLSIGELDKAMEDYGVLVKLNAADKKVLRNIDHINELKGMQGSAIVPGGQVPSGDNTYRPYIDSALALIRAGDTLGAFKRYVAALRINPQAAEKALAETSYSMVQNGQHEPAIAQYDMLLKLNTNNAFYYFFRGVAKFSTHRIRPAIQDWEIAVHMNSKDVQQSASYNLSVAYDSVGNDTMAYFYVSQAQRLGYQANADWVTTLKSKSDAMRARRKR